MSFKYIHNRYQPGKNTHPAKSPSQVDTLITPKIELPISREKSSPQGTPMVQPQLHCRHGNGMELMVTVALHVYLCQSLLAILSMDKYMTYDLCLTNGVFLPDPYIA